jgi:hypothetical protein
VVLTDGDHLRAPGVPGYRAAIVEFLRTVDTAGNATAKNTASPAPTTANAAGNAANRTSNTLADDTSSVASGT